MRPSNSSILQVKATPWDQIIPWLALVALILLTRPFPGIYHDGYLYAAQSLNHLNSSTISNDLIFAYGNQDRFTFFTALYAPVVNVMGLAGAMQLFWAMTLIFWLVALRMLTGKLFSDPNARSLAMAAVIVLTPNYGNGILSYAEPFVTPRPFAEALGMISITLSLRRDHLLAGVLVLFTGLLHPLTGIGVATLWAWLSVGALRQFVAIAVIGVALSLGLAVFAGPPFEWLLQRVDPDWQHLMRDQSALVFVSYWGLDGLAVAALPFTVLYITLFYGAAHHARLACAMLLVATTLLVVSLIGSDLLNNRLITMLQLWRGMIWPVLLGNLLAISAVWVLPNRSRTRGLLTLAIVLNIIEHLLGLLPAISATASALALIALIAEQFVPKRFARWVGVICVALAAIAALAGVTLLITRATGSYNLASNLMPLLRLGLVGIAILVLLRWVSLLLAGLSTLVILSAAIWIADARTPWQRFVDGPDPLSDEIVGTLSGRQVYWEDGLDLMWFKLGHSQFYSCRQKAGGLFFRGQAMEFARRAGILRKLNSDDFADDPDNVCPQKQIPGQRGPASAETFIEVCHALPELDLIVIRTGLTGVYRQKWVLLVAYPSSDIGAPANREVYLYDCADFR